LNASTSTAGAEGGVLDSIQQAITLLQSAVIASRVAHFQPSTAWLVPSVSSCCSTHEADQHPRAALSLPCGHSSRQPTASLESRKSSKYTPPSSQSGNAFSARSLRSSIKLDEHRVLPSPMPKGLETRTGCWSSQISSRSTSDSSSRSLKMRASNRLRSRQRGLLHWHRKAYLSSETCGRPKA
jgi:hypothetical protein